MWAGTRINRRGAGIGLLLAMAVGGSTSIGYQDISGRMAHEPGVAERARLSILGGPLHTLKAATFAWPSSSSMLSGSAISSPLPPALSIDVNRTGKTDRLTLAIDEPLEADPLAGAGDATPASLAGEGGATEDAATGRFVSLGSGTGSVEGSMGVGTDPYEETDEADLPDMAAAQTEGLYSVPAGDPTGDPSQLEQTGPAISLRGDGVLAEMDEEGPDGSYELDPSLPLYRQSMFIFGLDQAALPPQPFLHLSPNVPSSSGTTTAGKTDDGDVRRVASGPSPAERLGLSGKRRDRAEKCLAEAVYFESRGEPKRGQIAVAQVVMNRVFSGYYPADICRAVYQNAHRKLACQFTFACDNVRDVVTEPALWTQAKEIASDMLNGLVWDEKVGRATHYHARSVRPNWIREMRKLDRIGEHTFYRPRRWTS